MKEKNTEKIHRTILEHKLFTQRMAMKENGIIIGHEKSIANIIPVFSYVPFSIKMLALW